MERWVQGVREGISEFAVELSDRLEAGGERSECEQAIAARRADLAASLDETRAKMLEGLAAGPRNDDPSAHWQELRELEDQVLGDLFDQGPASQLLRTFDSDTAAALGG